MILDAERIAERMTRPVADPRAYLLSFYPALADRIPPLDHVVATARPMVAYVNGGIWKARCECGMRADMERGKLAPGCVVWLSVPLGFCLRCGNQATGRGWRTVLIPPSEERARIEAVLLCRPNEGDRNWESSESVEELLRQNREHGDPTPDDVELAFMGAH